MTFPRNWMNSNDASNDWLLQGIDYYMHIVLVSDIFLKMQNFIYCHLNYQNRQQQKKLAISYKMLNPRDLFGSFLVRNLPWGFFPRRETVESRGLFAFDKQTDPLWHIMPYLPKFGILAAFLWGDPDPDQWSKICLDHGASKEPANPLWLCIRRFLWCTMIQTDLGSLILIQITPKERSHCPSVAMLGPYRHDLGPIFPGTALALG